MLPLPRLGLLLLVLLFPGHGGFHGTYETTLPDFSYIPLELPFMSGLSSFTSLPSFTQFVPNITGRTLSSVDNSTGGVLGFEAALDMNAHIAVVPGIRTIAFSHGGRTVFLIRPEVGARWTF